MYCIAGGGTGISVGQRLSGILYRIAGGGIGISVGQSLSGIVYHITTSTSIGWDFISYYQWHWYFQYSVNERDISLYYQCHWYFIRSLIEWDFVPFCWWY